MSSYCTSTTTRTQCMPILFEIVFELLSNNIFIVALKFSDVSDKNK